MMTKKEQAEMDTLRQQLRLARAFRRTEKVEPDLVPPSDFRVLSFGYAPHVYRGEWRVDEECSSCINHGCGWIKTSAQHTVQLFSTRLAALRAARYALESQTEMTLAQIDVAIEKELANPSEIGGYKSEGQRA